MKIIIKFRNAPTMEPVGDYRVSIEGAWIRLTQTDETGNIVDKLYPAEAISEVEINYRA